MSTTYAGKPACDCMPPWIDAFFAKIGHTVTIYQLIGGAPASAGTHSQGGCIDFGTLTDDEVRVGRNMGAALWHRPPNWDNAGGSEHWHLSLKGCPHAVPSASNQVVELERGENGLANHGPDNGPRDGIQWPLRTWQEGIKWAKEGTDMPLTDDDANKVWTVKTQTPGGPEAAIDLLRSLAVDGAGIPLALLEAKFPHNGAMVPVADALNEILTKLENPPAPSSGPSSLSDADVARIAAAVTARLAGEIK